MTKTVEIVVTSFASLIVAGIIASVAWVARKRSDTLRLSGELSTEQAHSLIQSVGCPCLVLTVTNKAKRIAKIKAASLSRRNADVIGQFQEGFGEKFGFTPRPDRPHPLAIFSIGLLPFTTPTSSLGWCLERDDVCQFILPLLAPGLAFLHDAPSHDLSVEIQLFDNSKQELMRGDAVLRAIRAFVEMYRDHPYHLNPQIEIPVSLKVESMTLPDPSLIGATNQNPIVIQRKPKD